MSGPIERPGATPLAKGDLLTLAAAQRNLERERATRATVDAVDELAAAAEAVTVAHFRGEPIALDGVLDAVFGVMAAARRAGLVGGAR